MIKIGVVNTLRILRSTEPGLFLGDEEDNDVLLPNKYCPAKFEIGDMIDVFILRDSEDRILATNLEPKIKLNEFALLKVTAVTRVGAFLDWGMEKELMVPYSEQRLRMEEDRWYVVCMDLDPHTDRLFASNRIDRYIQNDELTVKEGDFVDGIVFKRTELGYSMILNNEHEGLLFRNDTYKELNVGERVKVYVKYIREDNKIDLSLQPSTYEKFISKNSEEVFNALKKEGGYLPITDKSDPTDIYDTLQISKKAFKKAIGDLYKQRKLVIEEQGIRLVDPRETATETETEEID